MCVCVCVCVCIQYIYIYIYISVGGGGQPGTKMPGPMFCPSLVCVLHNKETYTGLGRHERKCKL